MSGHLCQTHNSHCHFSLLLPAYAVLAKPHPRLRKPTLKQGLLLTLSLSLSKSPVETKPETRPLPIEVQWDPPWSTQRAKASGKWASLSHI